MEFISFAIPFAALVFLTVIVGGLMNYYMDQRGFAFNPYLTYLLLPAIVGALYFVGGFSMWTVKGIVLALILLRASVQDLSERQADEFLWVIQSGKIRATHDEMLTIGKASPEKRKELVDCLYQRKKDKDKIAHIVSKWDERIANEPKISARDGKFYVFDGQHTILARESMNGEKPTEILCKVYKGMDAKEEARLFAMQTGFSSKLRSGEALRANLFGEEAEAVAFNAATEKVGIQVELKGTRFERHLACVSTALNAYRNLGEDLYIEAMGVLFEVWGGKSDSLRFEVVRAITEFVGTYANVYARDILVDALKDIKEPIEIRDNIVTDIERPRNKKYIYQIWKIYNDYDPKKKLEKKF